MVDVTIIDSAYIAYLMCGTVDCKEEIRRLIVGSIACEIDHIVFDNKVHRSIPPYANFRLVLHVGAVFQQLLVDPSRGESVVNAIVSDYTRCSVGLGHSRNLCKTDESGK